MEMFTTKTKNETIDAIEPSRFFKDLLTIFLAANLILVKIYHNVSKTLQEINKKHCANVIKYSAQNVNKKNRKNSNGFSTCLVKPHKT